MQLREVGALQVRALKLHALHVEAVEGGALRGQGRQVVAAHRGQRPQVRVVERRRLALAAAGLAPLGVVLDHLIVGQLAEGAAHRLVGERAGHVGVRDVPGHRPRADEDGVAHVGPGQVRARQVGAGQVRAAHRGLLQVGADQLGVLQDRVGEIGADRRRAGQARAFQVRAGQDRALQFALVRQADLQLAEAELAIARGQGAFAQAGLEKISAGEIHIAHARAAQGPRGAGRPRAGRSRRDRRRRRWRCRAGPRSLQSFMIAPVKSASQRFRPKRWVPERSLKAKTARAPPGLELQRRSCLAQISSTSAWVRRVWTSDLALSADIRSGFQRGSESECEPC